MIMWMMPVITRLNTRNLWVLLKLARRDATFGKKNIYFLNVHWNRTQKTKPNSPPAGRRGRPLTDENRVWDYNNWDDVVWDSTQEEEARLKTEKQFAEALPEEERQMYEEKASQFWDEFYNTHTNRFFKDRNWLFVEFPELYSASNKTKTQSSDSDDHKENAVLKPSEPCSVLNTSEHGDVLNLGERSGVLYTSEQSDASNCVEVSARCEDGASGGDGMKVVTEGVENVNIAEHLEDCKTNENFPGESAKFRIMEVGCGVGNTVFPVLQTNNDPDLMVYCCDFSSTAIQIVKEHADYHPHRCHAFVCDISDPDQVMPMPDGSLDIIILIFVLSAINPERRQFVIDRLTRLLKPGGQLLFRDYGRYDLAQLRFKKGRCLSENFYVRGDGTRVYFFTQEELKDMFIRAGLEEKQNLIDRRLQVNRGKQLKMYRVWIQCKYQKPLQSRGSHVGET